MEVNNRISILYIGNKLSAHGLTPGVIEALGPNLQKLGFQMHYAGTKLNPLIRIFEMLWKTISLRNRVQLLLIDTYSTNAFWFSFIIGTLARVLRIPYVPILHGGNLPSRLDKWPKISRFLFSRSKVNIAPSNYLFNEFKKRNYNNVELIPNPINIYDYKFKLRNHTSPYLLWVRSFDKTYNCEMAIQVLSILKVRYSYAKLCMVGPDKDGSLESTKSLAKKLNVIDSVVFTGKLTKSDWHLLSEDYDIFINTTNFDNSPLSVIEAMALGLPVVSTNVGGIPYLIENDVNGVLIGKDDSISMANGIIKLIENSDFCSKICKSARSKVEILDWENVKGLWERIITNQ